MVAVKLHAKGPRALVKVEEAQEILKSFEDNVSGGGTVETLNLSCRAWPRESLEIFRSFFQQHVVKTVVHLKIDDVIASLETEHGLSSLQFFAELFATEDSVLEVLDLSDNAIGTRGAEVLKPLLQVPPKLSTIYMNNCGLSKEAAEMFVEILKPVAPRLKSLALGRNQMGPGGAEHFGKGLLAFCTALESFEYAGSRPLKEGTRYICQGLAEMVSRAPSGETKLVALDLNDCTLEDGEDAEDPVHSLQTVLSSSPNISKLILRDTQLQKSGFELIVSGLRHAKPPLANLDVGGNELAFEGTEVLATFIEEVVSDSLYELVVDTNELGDDGVEALVKPLVNCPKLELLDLQCNEIEEAGMQALLDNKIPNLKKLHLGDNLDIPPELVSDLRKIYPKVLADLDGDDEDEGDKPDDAINNLTSNLENSKIG